MDLPIHQTNFRTYLYDAHTKELLATIKREGAQPPFGEAFDNFYEKSHSGFEAATEYIDKLMAPERL